MWRISATISSRLILSSSSIISRVSMVLSENLPIRARQRGESRRRRVRRERCCFTLSHLTHPQRSAELAPSPVLLWLLTNQHQFCRECVCECVRKCACVCVFELNLSLSVRAKHGQLSLYSDSFSCFSGRTFCPFMNPLLKRGRRSCCCGRNLRPGWRHTGH